jgi:hypothetical protein
MTLVRLTLGMNPLIAAFLSWYDNGYISRGMARRHFLRGTNHWRAPAVGYVALTGLEDWQVNNCYTVEIKRLRDFDP